MKLEDRILEALGEFPGIGQSVAEINLELGRPDTRSMRDSVSNTCKAMYEQGLIQRQFCRNDVGSRPRYEYFVRAKGRLE